MKFCKDCKWYERVVIDGGEERSLNVVQLLCKNPKCGEIDPVTGGTIVNETRASARFQRFASSLVGDDVCGMDAKWFEPIDALRESPDAPLR